MISSNAISSHSTDTAALAACVNAASCYGISYEPSLAASVRWSARLGGAGVNLFTMQEVDSWVYSGSCERRLEEEWAEESQYPLALPAPPQQQPQGIGGFLRRLAQSVASIGDLDEQRAQIVLRPAHGPVWGADGRH